MESVAADVIAATGDESGWPWPHDGGASFTLQIQFEKLKNERMGKTYKAKLMTFL